MTAAKLSSTQADYKKRCNRHAEQERVYIKVYTRVEKIQVILTQVWCDHCGIRGSIAHFLYGLPR